MKDCKPNWRDGYRYLWKDAKAYWDRNGGKICTIVGTTGLFLSGVHACRTTYKHHDELRQNGERISRAFKRQDDEKNYKRYLRAAKEVAISSIHSGKHYIPDIVAASLSSYVTSKGWGIEHTHYENAATMVGVITADFLNYRKNVIDEHGREADRRYLTRRKVNGKIIEAELEDGTKLVSSNASKADGSSEGFYVSVDPGVLKIWYSRETTPQVWHSSHALRMSALKDINNRLDHDLMYGGHLSVNDVRREFYGRKGDVACGGMFGRIWDPGNPEHPERGALVNLHYEEDENFMSGLTDSCWIFIDIDEEPLFETMKPGPNNFTEVEMS